jgi:transposase
MVVVTDHDSRVIARRTFRCRAWDLGVALDWAAGRAAAKGWAGLTVSCEPTGHRWRVLAQLAADRSMPFVCVQPMVTSWSRLRCASPAMPSVSPLGSSQDRRRRLISEYRRAA